MNLERISHNRITWINIEKPTVQDIAYLRDNYPFHPLALEDCLSRIERPKIDEYDDHLFIVMHFPVFDHEQRISRPSEVDFFIGKNYLVTVHDGILKPITNFYDDCQHNLSTRERFMGSGAGALLHSVIDRLVDYMFPILNKIDSQISQIEDNIFMEDTRNTVQEISLVRRDVISLRRIVRPQVSIVGNLEQKSYHVIHDDLDEYFGDIFDHITQVRDILEENYEIIADLSEATDSLISFRINEVMRTLTVISVVMLPLTLITGVYGMNVDLPFDRNPYAFFGISGAMVLVLTSMLLYFRHRRWL